MEFLQDFLPILIYLLLIIILIVGIILGINFIKTMKKVEKVVDDVNDKVDSLNGFFSLIDFTTDKIVGLSDKVVDKLSMLVGHLFGLGKTAKKKKNEVLEKEKGEEEE